jgi:hypothetical protein
MEAQLHEDTELTLTLGAPSQVDSHKNEAVIEAKGTLSVIPPPRGYIKITDSRILATGTVTNPVTILEAEATSTPIEVPNYAVDAKVIDPTCVQLIDKFNDWDMPNLRQVDLRTDRDKDHTSAAQVLIWKDITTRFVAQHAKAFNKLAPSFDSAAVVSAIAQAFHARLGTPGHAAQPVIRGPLQVVQFLAKHFSESN